MSTKTDRRWYRYKVVEVWGDVPESIADLVAKPEAFLIYPKWKGTGCQENIMNLAEGKVKGGWYMTYVNRCPDPGPDDGPLEPSEGESS